MYSTCLSLLQWCLVVYGETQKSGADHSISFFLTYYCNSEKLCPIQYWSSFLPARVGGANFSILFNYSVHKLGFNFANYYTCICSYIDSPMISWDRSDGIAEHRHNIWVDTLYKASSCPILTPTQQLKQNKKKKATSCMIWHANTGPDILFLNYGTRTFPSSPATNEHLGDKCSRTGNICKNKHPVAKHI